MSEQRNLQLRELAIKKLVGSLQESVKSLDGFIASEIRKQFAKTFSVDHIETNNEENGTTSNNPESSFCAVCPLDDYTCTQAALQMLKIRKYMMNSVKSDSHPFILRYVIFTAIQTGNIPLVRLVLKDTVDILDFRALDYSLKKSDVRISELVFKNSINPFPVVDTSPSLSNQSRDNVIESSSSLLCTNNELPLLIHCLPPDEFDWFSRDKLGKIITMPEAAELFSIIKMSSCAPNLKELYVNARRQRYWTCSPELMEILADTLIQMNKTTTLVLRGLCDDYMLKLIGLNLTGLKRLDISGSQFVTDSGIKNLFFSDITENPATYLLSSWIKTNLNQMNPLVHSLETLDYSWTSVTSQSRKMVQYIPGTYMFKRVFASNENDSYGHHIFIRTPVVYHSEIFTKFHPNAKRFETELQYYVGQRGMKTFTKFMEQHPWRNCILSIYTDANATQSSDDKRKTSYFAIIIPNEDERRVHGIVNFQDECLIEIYSVFPVNLNILGEVCPKLQAFRGIITDVWKLNTSILSEITTLDMFADPSTTKSIIESCPNLKKVRIRIIRQTLTDDHIMKSISSSMCRRTLEDLWIAPGSYKSGLNIENLDEHSPSSTQSNYYAAANPPRMRGVNQIQSETNDDDDDSETEADCPIDDLVNLTTECVRTLIKSCKKLKRLGDIAWWTPVSQEHLQQICQELKSQNSNVSFIWENYIFPDIDKVKL